MEVKGFEGRIEIGVERDYSPDAPFTAITAVDQQALGDLLTKCGEFTITMPCGQEQSFADPSDIPSEDLACPCGADGHYLIRYKKER